MGIFESFDEEEAVSAELEEEDVTPETGSSDDEEPEGDEAIRKIYQHGRVVAPEYEDTLLQEAARLLAEAGLHNDAAPLTPHPPRAEVVLGRNDAPSCAF